MILFKPHRPQPGVFRGMGILGTPRCVFLQRERERGTKVLTLTLQVKVSPLEPGNHRLCTIERDTNICDLVIDITRDFVIL